MADRPTSRIVTFWPIYALCHDAPKDASWQQGSNDSTKAALESLRKFQKIALITFAQTYD